MVGPVSSCTVILCSMELSLPHSSVAVYLLVMVYLLLHVQSLISSGPTVIIGLPVQLSLALTSPVFGKGTSPTQFTVTSDGIKLISGDVWSSTIIV